MEKKLEQIEKKIDKILEFLQINKLNYIKENIKEPREVKLETLFSLDDDKFIESCLIKRSIDYDLKLIKKYYFPSDRYSIIKCKNQSIKYWLDGKWNKDILGEYTKSVLCKNLINCYLKINTYERYENNIDNFIENQTYIKKLGTLKYQNNLIKVIIKELVLTL